MKKLSFFSILFLVITTVNAQWEFQNPEPTSAKLNDIFFIDEGHGWAVGDYLTILYSDDGGQNWIEQLNADSDSVYQYSKFNRICFTDSNNGWAVGQKYSSANSSFNGLVFRTQNGGETWTEVIYNEDSYNFTDVWFFNDQKGWIIDTQGKVLFTDDGGSTWEIQYNDTTKILSKLDFSNEYDGWVVGSDGLVIKTLDGGGSWSEHESGYSLDFLNVCFPSRTTGYMSGCILDNSHYPIILKTSDGGENWEVIDTIGGGIHSSMYFADSLNGWITYTVWRELSPDWYVYITHDGGQTWNKHIVNSQTVPYILAQTVSVFFIDVNNGWIVAENVIFKSTDSGEEWIPINTVTDINLYDIWFADENNGWAVGQETYHLSSGPNVILHTNDGGQNWGVENGGYIDDTIFMTVALSFIDSQNGWVLGSGSPYYATRILKTTDGGKTWLCYTIPYSDFMKDIFFSDSLNGWLLHCRYILNSSDGGESWSDQYFPNYYLRSIFFINNQIGWVVGSKMDSALILNTNDGGDTWDEQFSDSFSSLNSVFFLDELNGWVVGQGQVILHTNDGGLNWYSQESESSCNDYQSVYFVDNNIGWVVGSNEDSIGCQSILFTSDGGENWIEQYYRSYGSLYAAHFVDSEIGWIVGEGGTIMHTDNGGTVNIETPSMPERDQTYISSHPNPFTTSTTISYNLPQPSIIQISIFNHFGQQVDFIQQNQSHGEQQITWDASDQPPGMYYFRLEAGEQRGNGKALLIK